MANGKRYAESWLQINIGPWSWYFSKKKIRID
nr:MAG TPA: hypothetical protein [Caudoviricetes sp.]